MALQPVDLAVAIVASWVDRREGAWKPVDIHRALGLPWSTLSRSLDRLRAASIVRDDHVSRAALVSLLPVLRYLFPLEVSAGMARGVPTTFASQAFAGHIRYDIPQVWPDPAGPVVGHPVVPLLAALGEIARREPALGEVFALVDAVRGGRAREVAYATERLRDLLALPEPFGAA